MIRLGLVASAGAVIGSLARYGMTLMFPHNNLSTFPWATFLVNIVGALGIGLIARVSPLMEDETKRAFLVTGVLGGFTTFSALALETVQLLQTNVVLAFVYILATFGIGVTATLLSIRSEV